MSTSHRHDWDVYRFVMRKKGRKVCAVKVDGGLDVLHRRKFEDLLLLLLRGEE